jgi:transcriptional regulator with XRE-family HTH domain
MTFAARLREIMKAHGLTQSHVARELHITSQAVSQWAKPGGTRPVGDKLDDVAKALRVTTTELMSPVGSPFNDLSGAGPALPSDPPKKSRLVDEPDKLALLKFWDDLETEEERIRAFRILRAAAMPISKRS